MRRHCERSEAISRLPCTSPVVIAQLTDPDGNAIGVWQEGTSET
jgi:predicted enzyme related to lactoylglutathione lyase